MLTISVIIPAYNAANTILETLESIQKQTIIDIEILVIDDGCTDNTVQLVESLRDPRIRIFSYENGGLPTARNRGIAQAQGEFIAFLDADDLWTVDKLECQLKALQQNSDAGVAYSWTAFMEANQQGDYIFYPAPSPNYSGNVYPQILVNNFIYSGSNILARREVIKKTGDFALIPSGEDWDYWIRLAANCPFTVVPKYQILYRRNTAASSTNMSTKVNIMAASLVEVINRAYQAAPPELQKLKSQTLAGYYIYCADISVLYAKGSQDLINAQRYFWKALSIYPSIILNKHNFAIFVKSFLRLILPKSWTKQLLGKVHKSVTITDPRLQN
ncbi:MAG: glycosyltransferase [Snowella sp.]|nr:glycosyltransferase [Snowella sp.]